MIEFPNFPWDGTSSAIQHHEVVKHLSSHINKEDSVTFFDQLDEKSVLPSNRIWQYLHFDSTGKSFSSTHAVTAISVLIALTGS